MRRLLCAFALLGFLSAPRARADRPEFDHGYPKWAIVLHDFVTTRDSRTQVKLDRLRLQESVLRQTLREFESTTSAVFSRFDETQKKAFLINAFNAAMVRFILDCKGDGTLKGCGHWYRKYGRMPFLTLFGKTYSMDETRGDWLRFKFKDPRVLFALFDGTSQSVPIPLVPLTPKNLEETLNRSLERFMKDRTRNRYDPAERKVHVARLFKKSWMDFEVEGYGPLKAFFGKWLAETPEQAAQIAEPSTVIVIEDENLALPIGASP